MSQKKQDKNQVYLSVNQDTNENNSEIFIVKILLVGNPGVGKSNFIYRYIKDKFSNSNLSSVGFESNSKEIEITDKKIIVQLWDSAGQDKYKSITKNLFTRVQGIIILYDITNKKSFLCIQNWIKLIKEVNNEMPYVIAGNKCDLKNAREVEEEEAIKFSRDNNIEFMETSAKLDINIVECINNFVQNIVNSDKFTRNVSFALQNNDNLEQKSTINKNEKCC